MTKAYALHSKTQRDMDVKPFHQALADHGLSLTRGETNTLQINTGLLCNQRCRHCHLEAGPDRKENMDAGTAEAVIAYAARGNFETIDITGGAPELNAHIHGLVHELSPLCSRLMFRSNLSALNHERHAPLMALLKEKGAVVVASLPSVNEAQADSQRGSGVFEKSIEALKKLNRIGYGREDTGLQLDLVCNPAGAFLPAPQDQTAKRFREQLLKRWGIVFNSLYGFANVPLGRFRKWLDEKGNFDDYMMRLISSFNACAVEGLMCRTLVSVSWDGFLYDCDFNLSKEMYMGKQKTHVSEMDGPPPSGRPIAVADHCYTCTAGAGFT